MMNDEVRLFTAVQLVRERLRDGMQPAPAAAPMRLLGFDADRVRTLAVRAEDACKQTRAELHAEKEARALLGAQEPTV
jgi:hypothetical protein